MSMAANPILFYTDQLRADLAIDIAAGPPRAKFAADKQARLSSAATVARNARHRERIRSDKRLVLAAHQEHDVRVKALAKDCSPESLPVAAIAGERAAQTNLDLEIARLDRTLQAAIQTSQRSRLLLAETEYREAASRLLPIAARYLAAQATCSKNFNLRLGLVVTPDQFQRAKTELAAEIEAKP